MRQRPPDPIPSGHGPEISGLPPTTPAPAGGQLVLVHGRDPFTVHGGGESYVRAVCRIAGELGLRPHVFAISRRADVRETEFATVHLVGSPLASAPYTSMPVNGRLLRRAVLRFLRDRPGRHVVHGFHFWAHLSARDRRELRAANVDVDLVTTAWTTAGHESPAKLRSEAVQQSARLRLQGRAALAWNLLVTTQCERRVARSSRLVLVNYESVRELVQRAHGPNLPIRHIGYVAETAFADEPGAQPPAQLAPLLAQAAPLILSMSRHDGRKGLDVLVRALALLRDRGVAFVACLAGGGILWERHRALVAELALTDRVLLPGIVPEAMPFLRSADIFVLPSIEEGSGSVAVLEALQAGLPVVATDVDGMPEDLTHGKDALLVPPADPAALAAALERLIGDPKLRERLAGQGRALYERRFSPAVAVAELGQVYSELGLLPAAVRA